MTDVIEANQLIFSDMRVRRVLTWNSSQWGGLFVFEDCCSKRSAEAIQNFSFGSSSMVSHSTLTAREHSLTAYRFDVLRGISGPEKLSFPSTVRDFVSNTVDYGLQCFTGCPRSIFKILTDVLSTGKAWLADHLSTEIFQVILSQSAQRLHDWDMHQEDFPDSDPGWPLLADAYRHTALLRILRFPDTFLVPASDPSIKNSVDRILDISALISQDSPCYKRLVFPLFMAGADTNSPHQQRYVQMCLGQIKDSTRIAQPALFELLDTVKQARASSSQDRNVPWMEWVCVALPCDLWS